MAPFATVSSWIIVAITASMLKTSFNLPITEVSDTVLHGIFSDLDKSLAPRRLLAGAAATVVVALD